MVFKGWVAPNIAKLQRIGRRHFMVPFDDDRIYKSPILYEQPPSQHSSTMSWLRWVPAPESGSQNYANARARPRKNIQYPPGIVNLVPAYAETSTPERTCCTRLPHPPQQPHRSARRPVAWTFSPPTIYYLYIQIPSRCAAASRRRPLTNDVSCSPTRKRTYGASGRFKNRRWDSVAINRREGRTPLVPY